MLKEIVTVPDEILKKISDPIEKVGINEKKLIEDLFETMYHSKGIGLAAVCDGLLSTCIQHEINHLDGKLIIDHLSKLKKDFIIKKISKIKKNPDRIVV